MSILKFFRAARTVETIVAPITNIVTQLEEHAVDNQTLAAARDAAANEALKLRDEAKAEGERALAAAKKFAGAFSL